MCFSTHFHKNGVFLNYLGFPFKLNGQFPSILCCRSLLFHAVWFASFIKEYHKLGSSVSIVSDYGLDDRAIGVRSPAGVKDFSSSLCVQTTQPPIQWVPGVLSPVPTVQDWLGRDADHSPHFSAEVKNE
jgi:hypothetical protein